MKIAGDIASVDSIPQVELVAAGFPCQDLSIAGRRQGIQGPRSSLVRHVFRLIDGSKNLKYILLENVPFMLKLDDGEGMRFLVEELESRGLKWAYRVVDTRAFGLPHRRNRVILLASYTENPWDVLLVDDAHELNIAQMPDEPSFGFYWTEGNRGIGWSPECVPPIKIGSGLGIPSSPAVWSSISGEIFKLDIRDMERLQGFQINWTQPAETVGKATERWKLVGNSVSVPLGKWVGERLRTPLAYDTRYDRALRPGSKWPNAAYGLDGNRYQAEASPWPKAEKMPSLMNFLHYRGVKLSSRAAAGLLKRIDNGTTTIPNEFRESLCFLAKKEKSRMNKLLIGKIENDINRYTNIARKLSNFAEQVKINEKISILKKRLAEIREQQ